MEGWYDFKKEGVQPTPKKLFQFYFLDEDGVYKAGLV